MSLEGKKKKGWQHYFYQSTCLPPENSLRPQHQSNCCQWQLGHRSWYMCCGLKEQWNTKTRWLWNYSKKGCYTWYCNPLHSAVDRAKSITAMKRTILIHCDLLVEVTWCGVFGFCSCSVGLLMKVEITPNKWTIITSPHH